MRSYFGRGSALARLVAGRGLVDDVDAALAANHAVVAVAALEGFQRVLDLNRSCPSVWPTRASISKARPFGAPNSGRLIDEEPRRCQPCRAEGSVSA